MKNFNIVTSITFLIVIFVGGIFICYKNSNSFQKLKTMSHDSQRIETIANSSLNSESIFLNMYGLIHRIIGKNEVKNFQVFKDNEDNLYLDTNSSYSFDQYLFLYNFCKENNVQFLFAQVPFKTPERIEELSGYTTSQIETDQDNILAKLNDNNIPNIDLRDFDKCNNWYKTDHHWTVEAAFHSAIKIIEVLNSDYNMKIEISPYSDLSQYSTHLFENSMLGSSGIKVGEWYVGKDDFILYTPNFETHFTFEKLTKDSSEIYTGDFSESFIDFNILNDSDYYNKYNALLQGGWYENNIFNHQSKNNLKVLCISHSYGRALVPYLSMYFSETRYIDPQEGRYSSSVVEYIREYKPDIVLMMYNGQLHL